MTLPFAVWVVVVTVTPDPLVVATECVTCGPVVPFVAAVAPAPAVVEAVPAVVAAVGKALWASATVVAPVPAISAASVQFDIRRTRRMPSRRARTGLPAQSGSPNSGSGTRPSPGGEPPKPGSGTRPWGGAGPPTPGRASCPPRYSRSESMVAISFPYLPAWFLLGCLIVRPR